MAKCKHCKSLLPLSTLSLFCPECGDSTIDVEKELISRKYEGKKRLKMNLQMAFVFIPLLAFLAAYRTNKLHRFVLIHYLAFIVSSVVAGMGLYTLSYEYPSLHLYPVNTISFVFWFIITSLFTSLIFVRIIRRWTIEWNNRFDIHSLIHGTPEV